MSGHLDWASSFLLIRRHSPGTDHVDSRTFEHVLQDHGDFLRVLSRKYATGMTSPADLFHNLMLSCSQHMWEQPEKCKSIGHVRIFARSRAIDSYQRERLRKRTIKQLPEDPFVRAECLVDKQTDSFSNQLMENQIKEAIRKILPQQQAEIVCELVWPSIDTQKIACQEAEENSVVALGLSILKMNCRDPLNARVLQKHVATSLGLTKATVSRAVTAARTNIEAILGFIPNIRQKSEKSGPSNAQTDP